MSDQTDNKGFLKEKLGDYQVNPPEEVWNAISGQINNGRKRRGMYILLFATAASIALAITLGIHFFGPDLPRQQSHMEEVQVEEEATENEMPERQSEQTQEAPQTLARNQIDLDEKDASEIRTGDQLENRELADTPENRELADTPEPINTPELVITPEAISTMESHIEPEPAIDPVAQLLPDTTDASITDPYPMMEQEKKRDPRWMVGAAISPLYSFRDAENVAMPSNTAESPLLSYSTGVNVSYRRNSRLAFETGIYYNRTGIVIGAPGIQVFSQRYDAMIFGAGSEMADFTSVSNSVGNIVAYDGDIYMNGYKVSAENGTNAISSDALEEVQTSESGIQQHLDFLELPFNLRYSVIDRTIELQLVGGMSTNFLVGNSVTIEGSSGREEIGYLSNVNTVNYSANAGLGMIYHMGSKLNLILEPRFRYFIRSVNDASLPSTRPYSLGFYTGLSYTF